MRPFVLTLVVGVVLAVALGACASVDVPESLPGPTSSTTAAPEADQPAPECDNPEASLRPSGPATTSVPAGTTMAEIRERGRLRVGVDVGTFLFSSVDPLTSQFTGFDVDIAKEVAIALFGNDDDVEFVGIPSSEREAALTGDDPRVDLVASTFTITCERRENIEFSTEYFMARQTVLVRSDLEATTVADLADREVCASAGSTAIDNIAALPEPRPEVVTAPQRADCLVRLQQGDTDGVATDDAILAGMAAQDPSLSMLDERFSEEHYGLGLPPGDAEWVRYVNAVLEDVRSSGRWDELFDEHLAGFLPAASPPTPQYSD